MAKRTHSKQPNLAELQRIVTGAVSSALCELGSSSSSRAGVIEDESDAKSDIEDFVTTPIKRAKKTRLISFFSIDTKS